MLNYITWNVDPTIFSLGGIELRWYGLIFAAGLFLAIEIIGRTFRHENAPEGWVDKVFIYLVIATVLGARLGHVFFYDWDYYSHHIGEILMVWKGGLASHGATAALFIGCWLISKYLTKQSIFWLTDRVMIGSAIAATMIRISNLMNSEIYGRTTDLPWGFVFVRGEEKFFDAAGNLLPCHPTQLYEALAYLLIFGLLMFLYWKRDGGKYNGLLTGVGFTAIFLARQIIETVKNPQVGFETEMTFNMGQWLSVPFVVFGIILIIRALKKGKMEYHFPKVATSKTKATKK